MTINTDTATSIIGILAGVSILLGQAGVIEPKTSAAIAAIAIAANGILTNKAPLHPDGSLIDQSRKN
jgi:hypothetical protein